MVVKVSERKELLWRLLVAIVSGIILGLWKFLVCALSIVNVFIVLFKNKRNDDIADFCEYWNGESYIFMRYMTFESNERPFPFNKLKKIGKFEK
jgi:hypothetical protein